MRGSTEIECCVTIAATGQYMNIIKCALQCCGSDTDTRASHCQGWLVVLLRPTESYLKVKIQTDGTSSLSFFSQNTRESNHLQIKAAHSPQLF